MNLVLNETLSNCTRKLGEEMYIADQNWGTNSMVSSTMGSLPSSLFFELFEEHHKMITDCDAKVTRLDNINCIKGNKTTHGYKIYVLISFNFA